MITVLLGTRAQLIKMAPVILELERRGWALRLILTGQHKETMDRLLADFGIRTPPVLLHDGREVTGIGQVLPWFAKCLWRLWRDAKPLLGRRGAAGVILVHGDTFSTLLGAVAGRLAGLTVAHVESGLRSFNLMHPFPEELTRLAVFRLAHLAFCPDDWAAGNLAGHRLQAINTGGNTLLDALRVALAVDRPLPRETPPGVFGVVSLHRFENIFRQERLRHILSLVEEAAERHPLVFVLHPATRRNLEKFGLLARLEGNPRIGLWPRMGYFEFVSLISRAAFVITDGGSNQEELSYLDKPTLLMRQATERQEGVGRNIVLSGYDRDRLRAFLDGLETRSLGAANLGAASPSAAIADALADFA
ncbi:UDP-N-acetyl glucosamine 2-epimerase [Azonexus sp.]|uniref:UDP-N-acetyl glucosamine 2-epimerase n=1 Tax=Azonexus sp. TaxID=1872668 RepID=UPI0035B34EE5